VVGNLATFVREDLAARGVTLEVALAGDLPRASVDEGQIRQAVLNLVRNAAEAIADGAAERRVGVRGSLEADEAGRPWVRLEVEDTGGGIAEGDLQRIFIPFFTTKSKGHGVGLALAHRVATDHGGTLSAANSDAGGALFTLRLPA
jgi:signal transduction histidine kinase